jgi:hypothetical protein
MKRDFDTMGGHGAAPAAPSAGAQSVLRVDQIPGWCQSLSGGQYGMLKGQTRVR